MTNKNYKENPINFIKDYRIGFNSQNKTIELLPLLSFEESIINVFHLNYHSIIMKSRQMHLTSLLTTYAAWYMIFQENKNISVVVPNSKMGSNFLRKVKIILDNYFKNTEKYPTDNINKIKLANGSSLEFITNASGMVSKRIDFLIIDEASFVKNLKGLWFSAAMSLKSNEGKSILCSSVNYSDDYFMQLFDEAKRKGNGFIPIIKKWNENPYYTTCYYNEFLQLHGKDLTLQELDCIPQRRTDKEKFEKNNIITFRVDSWMEKEINKRLIQKSEELKENYSISTYIRELIFKDLKQ